MSNARNLANLLGTATTVPSAKVDQDYKLIHTVDASSQAAITFTSSHITDTYMDYRIVYRYATPATNGKDFYLWTSIDNGSNYNIPVEQILLYRDLKASSATGTAGSDDTSNHFNLNASIHNSTSKGANGSIYFMGLRHSSASFKGAYWNSVAGISIDTGHTSGNDYWWNGAGKIITSSKINNIKITVEDGGNMAQGKFSLYGIRV